jgi:hypothetical protein
MQIMEAPWRRFGARDPGGISGEGPAGVHHRVDDCVQAPHCGARHLAYLESIQQAASARLSQRRDAGQLLNRGIRGLVSLDGMPYGPVQLGLGRLIGL